MLSDPDQDAQLSQLIQEGEAVLIVVSNEQKGFVAVMHPPVKDGRVTFQAQGRGSTIDAAIEQAVRAFVDQDNIAVYLSQGGDA